MGDLQSYIEKSRRCGRRFLDAAIPLLEGQRAEVGTDLYEPVVDEVLGGLLARTFRYLQTFVLDHHLWAEDLGAVVLRMMRESVFYMRFLAQQAEPAAFLEFQRYGLGQLKLYKLQLRKMLEEGRITDSVDLRNFIDSDCDEEVSDLLLEVRLKNFEDLRKLSEATGSKEEYVLHYQPESIIVHGHWPALCEFYLESCREPLHRWHLQPKFRLPSLDPTLVGQAVDLFATAYGLWIKKSGIPDVMEPLIDRYYEELEALASAEATPENQSS